jgi:hypothetical protein
MSVVAFEKLQLVKLLVPLLLISAFPFSPASAEDRSEKEAWMVDPDYGMFTPGTIAVLPMDNFSLEPDVEKVLYKEVYDRLASKGYSKISVDHVRDVMHKLGITTPGQLAGISWARLGKELNADAVLVGQIEQSGTVHAGIYDAVVVSCSLRLVHCATGKVLWQTEQWRAAHRQWQLDPINLFINAISHEKASREKRVAWLVSEMIKTLPQGNIQVESNNLLKRSKSIQVTVEEDK